MGRFRHEKTRPPLPTTLTRILCRKRRQPKRGLTHRPVWGRGESRKFLLPVLLLLLPIQRKSGGTVSGSKENGGILDPTVSRSINRARARPTFTSDTTSGRPTGDLATEDGRPHGDPHTLFRLTVAAPPDWGRVETDWVWGVDGSRPKRQLLKLLSFFVTLSPYPFSTRFSLSSIKFSGTGTS